MDDVQSVPTGRAADDSVTIDIDPSRVVSTCHHLLRGGRPPYPNALTSREMDSLVAVCDTFLPSIQISHGRIHNGATATSDALASSHGALVFIYLVWDIRVVRESKPVNPLSLLPVFLSAFSAPKSRDSLCLVNQLFLALPDALQVLEISHSPHVLYSDSAPAIIIIVVVIIHIKIHHLMPARGHVYIKREGGSSRLPTAKVPRKHVFNKH
ncbi:hypothetical protein ACLOJK_041754 [Asimina triloba]